MKKALGKSGALKWILFAVLLVYAVTLLAPFLWALMTSVKSNVDYNIFENKLGFPKSFALSNFRTAWEYGAAERPINGEMMYFSIPVQFVNSLLYSAGCMVAATLTPCLTAYAVARYRYRFGKVVYNIVVVAMILPIVGSLPSEIQMTMKLGLFDSFFGLWILKANFLGIYFLVFYAQFKMIPYDYTEAGKIDGASNFRIMASIILPLAKSTIFTVMLLTFVQFWNDYQIPMVYLPSHPVAAYGMYQFSQRLDQQIANVPTKIAFMIIVTIPILTVFLVFRKRLMSNMTIGGIKG